MICKTCKIDKSDYDFYCKDTTILRLSSDCKNCFNIKSKTKRGHIGKWKVCKKCSANFEPKEANSSYCEKCKHKNCPVCKKDFIPKNGIRKRCCSKECAYIFQKGKTNNRKNIKTNKICINCNNVFSVNPCQLNRIYCSKKCSTTSSKPERKKGKIIPCFICAKEKYKPLGQIKDVNFCSIKCLNIYQGKDKVKIECLTCKKEFAISASTSKNRKFCSVKCRNDNKEHTTKVSIIANLANLNKNGLNRLELQGNEILNSLGLVLNIDYQNQVVMFDKFCVDVLIESKKLIIQWDGIYWHNKPKRQKLDESQDAYFKKCGYTVLRITDLQIKNNIKDVITNIKGAVQ
jgi:very-short-patch-repair endonuclease